MITPLTLGVSLIAAAGLGIGAGWKLGSWVTRHANNALLGDDYKYNQGFVEGIDGGATTVKARIPITDPIDLGSATAKELEETLVAGALLEVQLKLLQRKKQVLLWLEYESGRRCQQAVEDWARDVMSKDDD